MEPAWQPTTVRLTRTSNMTDRLPKIAFFRAGRCGKPRRDTANREAVQYPIPGARCAPRDHSLRYGRTSSDRWGCPGHSFQFFIPEQHQLYDACCKRRLRANRPPAAIHASPMANIEVGSGTILMSAVVWCWGPWSAAPVKKSFKWSDPFK